MKNMIALTGIGYDIHRFAEVPRPLMLGGVHIPSSRGLGGHSDADVLCHAIADALLGAAGLDDIGRLFPDCDNAFLNISSLTLLERVMKALQEFLRPEFINRVDEIVCFNQLSEDNFRGIADIMLAELQQSLEGRGIAFTWDESVKDYLVKKSYSVAYGARNLRRAIQTDLEDPIAERIIKSYVDPFRSIKATCEDGTIKLETI